MAQTRATAMGLNGVIATPHYLASAAGLRVLQDGGNAVDAAVAACAVLGVVWPHMCGIGGDLFLVIFPAGGDRPIALNSSGRAGAKATADYVRAAGHKRVPDKGALAVVTPGCVAGWQEALQRYGTRELAPLLDAAIRVADEGFPISPFLARSIRQQHSHLNEPAQRTYAPNGNPLPPGAVLRQPDYAATLRRIAWEGPEAMYDGPLGEAIGRFLAAEGGHHGPEDIAAHRCEWVDPALIDFTAPGGTGYQVCCMPPNSQAMLHLIGLNVLESLNLGAPQGARATHLQLEAMKYAYLDRPLIADPAFTEVPVARMLSKAHAAAGRAQLSLDRASPPPAPVAAGDTVYLCAADRDGNVVSMIQSLRESWGSNLMVPELGMMLNDRGRDFGLEDGDPNQIAPGKRPRHTLSPSMVVRDGAPLFAYGTRGGDGQPFTLLQVICNLLVHGMDPQVALDAPRWSLDPLDAGPAVAQLALESRFSAETQAQLRAMGHPVVLIDDFDMVCGTSNIVQLDRERGILLGGADPRGDGVALAC
jgi:gamma-glutamyltranspeptidase/glutathione hydrolase